MLLPYLGPNCDGGGEGGGGNRLPVYIVVEFPQVLASMSINFIEIVLVHIQ